FKLSGPNGWVGFNNLTGDSDLINLPANGSYLLEVESVGPGSGSYAFRLEELTQTQLTLGVPLQGSLAGSGQAQLFKVNVPEGNPLRISFDDAANSDMVEVYAKLGA